MSRKEEIMEASRERRLESIIKKVSALILLKELIGLIKTFMEKACNWLEGTFRDLAGYYTGAKLLDDFKHIMEE